MDTNSTISKKTRHFGRTFYFKWRRRQGSKKRGDERIKFQRQSGHRWLCKPTPVLNVERIDLMPHIWR